MPPKLESNSNRRRRKLQHPTHWRATHRPSLKEVTLAIEGQTASMLPSWYLGVARELHKKPLLDSAVFVRNRNKYLRIKSDVLVTAETLAFQESYNLRYRLNLGR